jgi:hypothetical protein
VKVIVGKNDSGKTRQLIKQSLETDTPIFVLYETKADSIRTKALSYFGKPVRVVTPQSISSGEYSGDILVDDLEKAFATLLAAYVHTADFNVVAATITED